MQVGSSADVGRLPGLGLRRDDRPSRSASFVTWCQLNAFGAAYGLGTMLAALVSAALVLELWRANLHIPFAYSGDALFVEAVTKNLEHGWYYTNPHLAAPLGQQLYDFPIGNALNLIALKLLALAFSSPVVALNVFFLLTFPLTALTAFLVMRSLRIAPGAAAASSVLFALLPYHFRRGEQHAFLSAYYAVPVIAYLALRLLSGRGLFAPRDDVPTRRLRAPRRTTVVTLLLAVVVGAGSPYYAVGAAALFVIAAVVAGVAHHSIRRFVSGVALAAVVLATLTATAAPAIAYRIHHGANELAGKRSPSETELYGLKISELVLPLDQHRLKPLARIKQEYDSTSPVSSEAGQTLGFIGTAGLIALLGGGFIAVVRGSWRIGGATFLRVAAMTVVVLLLATTAGFSSVLSYTLSPQMHAWNRLSVLIGFFSFVAVAFILDALWWRWRATRLRFVFPFLLAALVVLGVLDQTSNAFAPPYKTIRATYRSDARFVAAVEQRLPAGAEIYQLPYVPFPESSIPGPGDYSQLRGYLHSDDLRWSYGAMKGRATDWNAMLSTLPLRVLLPAVAAIGFDGIVVDRSGYHDHGKTVAAELSRRLGMAPLESPDGSLLFYDLRPLGFSLEQHYSQSRLASVQVASLHPATIRWGDSFWPEETGRLGTWRWSKQRDAYFVIVNATGEPRRMTLRFDLAAGLRHRSNAIVFYPDGYSQLVGVTPTGTPVQRTFVVRPGAHVVRLSSDARKIPTVPGDPRSALYLRVAQASLTDAALAAFDRGDARTAP